MGESKRKREQFKHYGACVYCGARCVPTMDHVPPKGIFPKPRPTILVTVPSCQACNTEAGQIVDEEFKAALAIQVDPKASESHKSIAEAGLATLRKNKRLVRDLFSNSKTVWVKDTSGLLAPATMFHWSAVGHDAVISRITKGLYFHETKKSISAIGCDVEVFYFGSGNVDITAIARELNLRQIGNRQFCYSFGIADQDPRHSTWLYEFYETHYAGARTFPIGAPEVPKEPEPAQRRQQPASAE